MKGGYVAYENRDCLNCHGNQIHEKHPPHQKERCDRQKAQKFCAKIL